MTRETREAFWTVAYKGLFISFDFCQIGIVNIRRNVLLAFLGIIVVAILWPTSEPAYQGRLLSEWVIQYQAPEGSPQKIEAHNAIQHIGADAVPSLLNWLLDDVPGYPKFAGSHYFRLQWPLISIKSRAFHEMLRSSSADAFAALGPQANLAAEDLKKMMLYYPEYGLFSSRSGSVIELRYNVGRALTFIGEKGVFALVDVFADSEIGSFAGSSIQGMGTNAQPFVPYLLKRLEKGDVAAACALGWIGTNAGPNAHAAVPFLIKMRKSEKYYVSQKAEFAVSRMKLIVPVMISDLQEANFSDRCHAASVLENLGSEARPAIPALRTALADPNYFVRSLAAHALSKIAPEIMTNAAWH